MENVNYYHIELENYKTYHLVINNNLVVESHILILINIMKKSGKKRNINSILL